MTYENVLSALADPTRRHLFETLAAGPRSVGALAAAAPVSRPAVSQHLKVLEGAGLVAAHAAGTSRVYRARSEGLAPLRAYLDRMWDEALSAFAAEVARQEGDGNA